MDWIHSTITINTSRSYHDLTALSTHPARCPFFFDFELEPFEVRPLQFTFFAVDKFWNFGFELLEDWQLPFIMLDECSIWDLELVGFIFRRLSFIIVDFCGPWHLLFICCYYHYCWHSTQLEHGVNYKLAGAKKIENSLKICNDMKQNNNQNWTITYC